MDSSLATFVLGIVDVVAGIVLLWAMQLITTKAGFTSKQARWALFRRAVYCSMSIALFCLGVHRLDGDFQVPIQEALFQTVLLFGVMIFPLLRAARFIDQDMFLAMDGFTQAQDRQPN